MEIINVGGGAKVSYEAEGSVLIFNGGELTLDLAKHQRDFARELDICRDKFGGLTMGLGENYAAQISIPAREYEYEPGENIAAYAAGSMEDTERQPEVEMLKKALPLDMAKVTLALW